MNFVCHYKGILLVLSGIGEMAPQDDPGNLSFLQSSLADNPESTWRVASWHKNQNFLQLCSKKADEIGWRPYEICREYGAIVNNAHEHSYARTHTLKDLSSRDRIQPANFENDVEVADGKTFVFVSGLGGHSVRRECNDLGKQEHWAAWAARNGNKQTGRPSTMGSNTGFMGCEFNIDGQVNKASCFFKVHQLHLFPVTTPGL